MTDTKQDLLDAIRRNREEDLPRLMYADAIEDEEPKLAEFIRLQVRIGAIQRDCLCGSCVKRRGGGQHHNGPCGVDKERDEQPDGSSRQAFLRMRENGLFKNNVGAWTDGLPEELITQQCPYCEDQGPDYETGIVECRQCECTGLVPNYDRIDFSRGFLTSAEMPWEVWSKNAATVLPANPALERVTLTTEPRVTFEDDRRKRLRKYTLEGTRHHYFVSDIQVASLNDAGIRELATIIAGNLLDHEWGGDPKKGGWGVKFDLPRLFSDFINAAHREYRFNFGEYHPNPDPIGQLIANAHVNEVADQERIIRVLLAEHDIHEPDLRTGAREAIRVNIAGTIPPEYFNCSCRPRSRIEEIFRDSGSIEPTRLELRQRNWQFERRRYRVGDALCRCGRLYFAIQRVGTTPATNPDAPSPVRDDEVG